MTTDLIRELISGTWFLLATIIFFMFVFIVWGAWTRHGYKAPSTKAAVALSVFFLGMSGWQGWTWLHLWLPRHGFNDQWIYLSNYQWIPVALSLMAMTGALCLIRVFWPIADGRKHREAVWIIPVVLVIIIKLILALI